MDETTRGAIRELKVVLQRVYADRFAQLVIFGSQSRGDATPESDIDAMIVLRGRVDPFAELARVADDVYQIELAHGVLFALVPVSEADFRTRETPLLANVRREGVSA